MQSNVPYLAPHMGSWLALLCVCIMIFGLWLWWQSGCSRLAAPSADSEGSVPETYHAGNVRRHTEHYVEEGGVVQVFSVLGLHAHSGHFHIEVIPPEGHELDRDYRHIRGWARELPSNRLIRQEHLLRELPLEMVATAN